VSTDPASIATIFTTRDGVIEWTDAGAPALLNVSARCCLGRNLVAAFAQNRLSVIAAMRDAAAGDVVRGEGIIRPRERKPRPVLFTVTLDPDDQRSLKWVFEVSQSAFRGDPSEASSAHPPDNGQRT
jgi:hypothetical protein